MKVLGFAVIAVGMILIYIAITGSQHNIMAIIEGKKNVAPSEQNINPSGVSGTLAARTQGKNKNPGENVT